MSECFYPKNHISLFNGEYPHVVMFDDPHRTTARIERLADPARRVTFRTAASTLLHLDRSRFAAYWRNRLAASFQAV